MTTEKLFRSLLQSKKHIQKLKRDLRKKSPSLMEVRIDQDMEDYLYDMKLRVAMLEDRAQDLEQALHMESELVRKAVKMTGWALLGMSVSIVVLVLNLFSLI